MTILQSGDYITTFYKSIISVTLVLFVITLVLPKGLRKSYFGSNKRRYTHSSWIQKRLIGDTKIDKDTSSRRDEYVTLRDIDVNASLPFVTTSMGENDELSPLDCVHGQNSYQSMYRTSSTKSMSRYRKIFKYDSPGNSLATSFASTGIYSPSSELFKDGGENNQIEGGYILEETPKRDANIKMEYSPSPLSIVSGRNFYGGFIVLISGNRIKEDQNELSAIELLRRKAFKFYIVDARDPLQFKRRENLVSVSGIIGHYPQIFHINGRRKPTYIGNHEALFSLEQLGKLNLPDLNESITGVLSQVVGEDSSFFSV